MHAQGVEVACYAQIIPCNFAAFRAAAKLGLALAVGNGAVVKMGSVHCAACMHAKGVQVLSFTHGNFISCVIRSVCFTISGLLLQLLATVLSLRWVSTDVFAV